MADPILRPLKNIKHMDAILSYDETGQPIEPEWPAADVIIGNPPFLGGKRLRTELGNEYVSHIFDVYADKVPREADLVCYWFERSRILMNAGFLKRAGLLATNSIRGGVNRQVLDQIKNDGDIFLAWSDRAWILDGAAVRVSMIGFDNGDEDHKVLDGAPVITINSDLTSQVDITIAKQLSENAKLSFMGDTKGGAFDIDEKTALAMLQDSNNNSGKLNTDVVKPWINASDITNRSRNMWIIDFGLNSEDEASFYQKPFEYILENVKPMRMKNRRDSYRKKWWIHMEPRPAMWEAIASLSRYIATPGVAKHRMFVWRDHSVVPDHAIFVFARDDDYFFGVLHSHLHEIWALRLGTWLGKGNDPRYTPTTTFETFPFPWPPGQEPSEADDPRVKAIANWARALVAWREAWLNPPPPQAGTIDVAYDKMLQKRTLTNLYNGLQYYRETIGAGGFFLQSEFDKVTRKSVSRSAIEELHDIHAALDYAVLDAYGWPHSLTDEEILEHLLALNLERAAAQS